MLMSYTVVDPFKIDIVKERSPTGKSRHLTIKFEGRYPDDDRGSLTIIDYDVERAERLFKAISEALEPPAENAEAA